MEENFTLGMEEYVESWGLGWTLGLELVEVGGGRMIVSGSWMNFEEERRIMKESMVRMVRALRSWGGGDSVVSGGAKTSLCNIVQILISP